MSYLSELSNIELASHQSRECSSIYLKCSRYRVVQREALSWKATNARVNPISLECFHSQKANFKMNVHFQKHKLWKSFSWSCSDRKSYENHFIKSCNEQDTFIPPQALWNAWLITWFNQICSTFSSSYFINFSW